jgi:glycosyltransferase involved in cell wall biosynthesis
MKVLILTTYPFPYGMAQSNRLIAMARGLHSAGAEVRVIVSKATERDPVKNKEAEGSYQHIPFRYSTGNTIRPSGTLRRIAMYYRGKLGMFREIYRENRKQKVDALFLGVYDNLSSLAVSLLARLLKIKLIQERSEYPFLSYSGIIGKFRLAVYLRLVCRLFDGFVVISRALQGYFRPRLRKKTPLLLLPVLVETERFINGPLPETNTISYCGAMQGSKDGVPILIEAFSYLVPEYPDARLRLIGSTRFRGFEEMEKRIAELKLGDRIEFTGEVSRDEMPLLFEQSRILALARPAGKQAEGGFPTKLGEYLAAGRLVVITRVGDIPDYLVDGQNALLAEPGSVTSFAEKLAEGLADPGVAERLAAEGRHLAENTFSYRVQGERLYHWIQKLLD